MSICHTPRPTAGRKVMKAAHMWTKGRSLLRSTDPPIARRHRVELLFRNDFDTRGHTVMSKAAKFITRHSETFLAEAQSLSHTGSFGWSVATGEIYWSAETSNIFEYDRTAKPTLEMVLRRTHPDDRDFVQQTRGRASEARADFELEHRLLMPNGSVKHLHVSARALTNSSGILNL